MKNAKPLFLILFVAALLLANKGQELEKQNILKTATNNAKVEITKSIIHNADSTLAVRDMAMAGRLIDQHLVDTLKLNDSTYLLVPKYFSIIVEDKTK